MSLQGCLSVRDAAQTRIPELQLCLSRERANPELSAARPVQRAEFVISGEIQSLNRQSECERRPLVTSQTLYPNCSLEDSPLQTFKLSPCNSWRCLCCSQELGKPSLVCEPQDKHERSHFAAISKGVWARKAEQGRAE